MKKIAQAKQLSIKAQNFNSEGNYDYAIRCYDKIILLLKEAVKQAQSIQTISQLKQKVQKYVLLKAQAETKKDEKQLKNNKLIKKRSGFGFPQKKDLNNLSEQIKVIRQPQKIKKKQENHIKFITQKKEIKNKGVNMQMNYKIDDPMIEDLIVKNINITFKDIIGLQDVKAILEEAVIRPRQRPDLYTGIRAPSKGILLYGPPGNGKTYICKALARQSGCTFLALSASSVLNKLVGQSQKTIKKIFQAAQKLAPSIIFIDQIDSMLTARSENQNDASRRLKTEFLVLMDGINCPKSGDVLVIGATNLPKELDPAAKRRFSKFVYIGHPDSKSRKQMLKRYLQGIQYNLSESDFNKISDKLQYFSASEIKAIISQSAMIPLRQLQKSQFQKINTNELRKLVLKDFTSVISQRKPIVSKQDLLNYKQKV